MSEPTVDVLAVLSLHTDECYRELRRLEEEIEADRASNYGKEYGDLKERHAKANAACVAVAELIEALQDCVEAQQPMAQMHATERARAALARVGGAK